MGEIVHTWIGAVDLMMNMMLGDQPENKPRRWLMETYTDEGSGVPGDLDIHFIDASGKEIQPGAA